ncbi:hypothetical protein GOP47_0000588 [Adiantum capillus-veneris]|uniref:Fe2OG dioxygenase domain-containing protein n=1 Tax=Adiantum capillus-veneris TaxID=13818 RepID=A0A9D4VDL3_ADICA|nr:hypothetical protein GOP47_0000588 [Adiantum capillus-veneris]
MTTIADDTQQPKKIRSIKELVDAGLQHVPAMYIRPVQERARPCAGSFNIVDQHPHRVPVISLSSSQRLQQVAHACSEWGIFQITDHGVSTSLQNQLWSAAYHFFSLPTETKLQLISQDPSSPLLFFTGFFSHEQVKEWKDTLGFKPSPSMDEKLVPYFLRGPMLNFHKKMRMLSRILCEAICSSLAIDSQGVCDSHLSRATMGFNYYPACPEPDLTFGLSSHSDFGSLTIIMQDEVKGLQVRRGDAWIDVAPVPNAFTVILGDQIEILTNGYYKSVEHRVLTNQTRPRMSIACFYGPNEHEHVKPLDQFVTPERPTMYKETKFSDYLKHGFSRGLNGKSNLQFSRHKLVPF